MQIKGWHERLGSVKKDAQNQEIGGTVWQLSNVSGKNVCFFYRLRFHVIPYKDDDV